MNIEQIKDRTLETSAIARRLYGIRLTLTHGLSDTSKWFLFDREKLKYGINFKREGLVLDIGSYLGEYTKKVLKDNPRMTFWLYEPIPEYFGVCVSRFKEQENVTVYQTAVSADGRNIQMQIDGLRSRQKLGDSFEGITISSIGIQKIFNSVAEIELLKMNIEGMEYECLHQLILTNSLIKAKYLLIQFHNFETDAPHKRDVLRKLIGKDFNNVYTFEWMWELWTRKGE